MVNRGVLTDTFSESKNMPLFSHLFLMREWGRGGRSTAAMLPDLVDPF